MQLDYTKYTAFSKKKTLTYVKKKKIIEMSSLLFKLTDCFLFISQNVYENIDIYTYSTRISYISGAIMTGLKKKKKQKYTFSPVRGKTLNRGRVFGANELTYTSQHRAN